MREVRVSNAFFDDVDRLLPAERGVDGAPSADDYIRYAVPSLIAEIGERFDVAADMPDAPGVRAFVLPGVLVPGDAGRSASTGTASGTVNHA